MKTIILMLLFVTIPLLATVVLLEDGTSKVCTVVGSGPTAIVICQ